jgi:hypothetical protein
VTSKSCSVPIGLNTSSVDSSSTLCAYGDSIDRLPEEFDLLRERLARSGGNGEIERKDWEWLGSVGRSRRGSDLKGTVG